MTAKAWSDMTPAEKVKEAARRVVVDPSTTMECAHCDAPFALSYLQWHGQRAQPGGTSILRCRQCGCMTPVTWSAA